MIRTYKFETSFTVTGTLNAREKQALYNRIKDTVQSVAGEVHPCKISTELVEYREVRSDKA